MNNLLKSLGIPKKKSLNNKILKEKNPNEKSVKNGVKEKKKHFELELRKFVYNILSDKRQFLKNQSASISFYIFTTKSRNRRCEKRIIIV